MAKAKDAGQWKNRIVAEGEEAPDQLLANPLNFRIHPAGQQEATLGIIEEVGLVQTVIVNRRTGRMLDGHMRVRLALRENQPTIPVQYVDLSEEEEQKVLATYDAVGRLATVDESVMRRLFNGLEFQDERLGKIIQGTKLEFGVDLAKMKPGEAGHVRGSRPCVCPTCHHEHSVRGEQ